MEKCFQMRSVKAGAGVIHQTHSSFAYVDNPCSTKAPVKPSIVTPPSSAHTFNRRVEAVTACSWTELVVAADMPVLVEFWAPWSGPSGLIDEVAKEYAARALCYKLNIDDYPNVALQYKITSIPSVLFYKNGENKEIIIGDVSKSTLCATLDKYLC
ncbi:hypothetical protein L1987_64366 [Smallanthus sonchifolius]|uniref:Uncharacterized protein n=1 Tax=Smallanthus sonchifolius TaxID=185202 RepID=A0ACB9CFS6_9ASTR|nr:hypothetical protein L1987_64366 [Smallanthus sonchifolius]